MNSDLATSSSFLPTVFLVGAGPGHPGLLTLRAVECLQCADVVLYDKLVPTSLLEHAPAQAEKICVADLADSHRDRHQPTMQIMLDRARQGKRIVRLKGGDPFIFGRGGEEAEALAGAGISFEVVPGVTSAVGATATAGIPITHRSHASSAILVAGHEDPDKPESHVDWPALARLNSTIIIYMGLSRLPQIVAKLLENGRSPDTPAALIHWGTTGNQLTITGPLHELPERVRQSGVHSPALIVIGDVVDLRSQLAWFERRPLFGHRVLVTRPKRQAAEFAHQLEILGAVPFILPAVEIAPLTDWNEVDDVLCQLEQFDWLVFTSSNGVAAFLNRLLEIGRDMRALGKLQIAAIGPRTAASLEKYHLRADVVPDSFCSEALVEALRPHVSGKRVLLARADRGRDVLPAQLSQWSKLKQLTVYRQLDAIDSNAPVLDSLRRGEIDTVTLTSPNIARALIHQLDEICRGKIERGEIQIVTISPVTSAAVRELGLPVAVEASTYTTEGLLVALVQLVQGKK